MDDGSGKRFGFWARALNPSPAFWLAMFVASAFGTVLGDFWAERRWREPRPFDVPRRSHAKEN
jgi:hypothetical protein